MYAWSISLAGNGVQNWATKTKGLLDSIRDPAGGLTMDEAWDSLAKLTLQDWERDLNSIPDNSETGGWLKFYRILKASPSVEQYIEAGISLNKRRVIIQLRTGCRCLPLEVELGRYRSPKTP